MAVDTPFGAWLKSSARQAVASSGAAATWGTSALSVSATSPLALAADAQAEAVRRVALLGRLLAADEHDVAGARADLLGRCVTLFGDGLGYETGRAVMVIGVEEKAGMTTLTVLVRL